VKLKLKLAFYFVLSSFWQLWLCLYLLKTKPRRRSFFFVFRR